MSISIRGFLTIRKTKFRKSRHVPVHRTVVTALTALHGDTTRYGDTGCGGAGVLVIDGEAASEADGPSCLW